MNVLTDAVLKKNINSVLSELKCWNFTTSWTYTNGIIVINVFGCREEFAPLANSKLFWQGWSLSEQAVLTRLIFERTTIIILFLSQVGKFFFPLTLHTGAHTHMQCRGDERRGCHTCHGAQWAVCLRCPCSRDVQDVNQHSPTASPHHSFFGLSGTWTNGLSYCMLYVCNVVWIRHVLTSQAVAIW